MPQRKIMFADPGLMGLQVGSGLASLEVVEAGIFTSVILATIVGAVADAMRVHGIPMLRTFCVSLWSRSLPYRKRIPWLRGTAVSPPPPQPLKKSDYEN